MVLIFGWGHGEVLDRGDVAAVVCPHCHNQVFLHEFRSQKQVSLYFVPIASSGSDVYLACPICRAGVEVPPALRSSVDAMIAATRMARTGQLAPDAYRAQTERFLAQVGLSSLAVPAAGPPLVGSVPGAMAASMSAVASDPAPIMADRIARLAALHADGVLTDEEFSAAKRRLLEE